MKQTIFIDDSKRTQKPRELFGIWVPTQIGILGVVYGAIIVSYQLNFIQSIFCSFFWCFIFFISRLFKFIWENW